MANLTWNYNSWKETNVSFFATQKDWNQTLITRFNEIHATHYWGKENLVKVPIKYKDIIKCFEYYNPIDNKIGSLYTVEFIDSDENKIFIDHHFVEIIGYCDDNKDLYLYRPTKLEIKNTKHGGFKVVDSENELATILEFKPENSDLPIKETREFVEYLIEYYNHNYK